MLDTASHRCCQRLRLLKDLFEHKMLIITLHDALQLPFKLLHDSEDSIFAVGGFQVENTPASLFNMQYISILQRNRFLQPYGLYQLTLLSLFDRKTACSFS
jgi:hypothetical protein